MKAGKMIFVYKTSINDDGDIIQIKPILDDLLGHSNWNFDLEDCDNILRVESEQDCLAAIIEVLQGFGHDCEELPD